MTRDEAIAIELKQIEAWEPFSAISPEIRHQAGAAQIDSYVALGMLKLDEPKNTFEKLAQAMGDGHWHINTIMGAIHAAGLKLIEK